MTLATAGFFDATDFVTRDHCGRWEPWLVWVAQAADLMVALAYLTIPIALACFWVVRRRRPPGRLVWPLSWFAAFILLCGLSHLCQVLAFHWPAYRLFTAVTLATGLVSVATAARFSVLAWSVLGSGNYRDAVQVAFEGREAELKRELGNARVRAETAEQLLSAERSRVAGLERALSRFQGEVRDQEGRALERASDAIDSISDGDAFRLPRPPPGQGDTSRA